MRLTCPHCLQPIGAETITGDASARELFARLGAHPAIAGELIAYLALFRPRTRALRWPRAFALADEIFNWEADEARLALALSETVEAFRERRLRPDWKPLKNHRYLLAVYEGIDTASLPAPPDPASVSNEVSVEVRRSHLSNEVLNLKYLINNSQGQAREKLEAQLKNLEGRLARGDKG